MQTIELVNLNLPSPGFDKFISSWIIQDSNDVIILDPGPTHSLHILYQALGSRVPNYILLTHIHVDHAGGVGPLSKKFPEAKIVAHEKAYKHLVEPSKLIEGSYKTLGSLMDLYGPIDSIKEESICKNFESAKVLETPGHASHHISFIFEKFMFCGEALGVIYPLGDDKIYLRPATPPIFNLEIYSKSIDLLESVYRNHTLCFGHFGTGSKNVNYFQNARDQIEIWQKVVRTFNLQDSVTCNQLTEIIDTLVDGDKRFRNFKALPDDIQERERIFITNSINGLI